MAHRSGADALRDHCEQISVLYCIEGFAGARGNPSASGFIRLRKKVTRRQRDRSAAVLRMIGEATRISSERRQEYENDTHPATDCPVGGRRRRLVLFRPQ
jgi:hypothetical protein